MASRLYFSETGTSPITPPAASGTDWGHINAVVRALEWPDPDASALTQTAYTPDAADHLVSGNALWRQYVSDPLAAQTISGTVTAQMQCLEANAGNNLFLTMKILVCSFDGSTTRATLLAVTRATSLEIGTALTNRTFPSTALTSYTCIGGDRLVIEIGAGGLPVATSGTQGHNFTFRVGGAASSGDLPVDETTTTATYRPWVQFSTDLDFFMPHTMQNYQSVKVGDGLGTGERIR